MKLKLHAVAPEGPRRVSARKDREMVCKTTLEDPLGTGSTALKWYSECFCRYSPALPSWENTAERAEAPSAEQRLLPEEERSGSTATPAYRLRDAISRLRRDEASSSGFFFCQRTDMVDRRIVPR